MPSVFTEKIDFTSFRMLWCSSVDKPATRVACVPHQRACYGVLPLFPAQLPAHGWVAAGESSSHAHGRSGWSSWRLSLASPSSICCGHMRSKPVNQRSFFLTHLLLALKHWKRNNDYDHIFPCPYFWWMTLIFTSRGENTSLICSSAVTRVL